MGSLVALALCTPIWGFALQPPMALSSIATSQARDVEVTRIDAPLGRASDEELAAEAHTRDMMTAIRAMQVATNTAMAATFAFAVVNFADRYGFHETLAETPCARGTPMLDGCGGTFSTPYLAAAITTGVLGTATFVVWTQTDLERATRMDGDWEVYAVTRLLARVMNAVGALASVLLTNAVDWGWADAQRDFTTLQGLAIAQTAWSAATLAVETANTVLAF